ncbi:hypothetical protein CN378_08650 [Bacillus sp. AFS015802]|nr:hypothetical protein CN378_08650 [Bacillus sp. AFS015802]
MRKMIENSILILCLTSSLHEGSILFGLPKKGRITYITLPLQDCKRGVFYFYTEECFDMTRF